MTDSSPGLLQSDMQELEQALMELMNPWSDAASELKQRDAQVERLKAPQRLHYKKNPQPGLEKATKEDLDALVLVWLWEEHEELMTRQIELEALCIAYETTEKVAAKALSSKQTRLNADVKLNVTGPSARS